MIKKVIVVMTAILFVAGMTPAFAAGKEKAGPTPNKSAYEHASDMARFKRTEGTTDKEARKAEREAEREKEKLEKEAEKEKRKAEKEAEKAQKRAEKEARKAEKQAGKAGGKKWGFGKK